LEKEGKKLLYENKFIEVYSFPVVHKVDTWGFSFEEKLLPRKLKKDKIEEYKIPIPWRVRIKKGEDFITQDGNVISNEELTLPPPNPRKYIFITDTEFIPDINKYFDNADIIYHESTFLSDAKDRAKQTKHSTAKDAGKIAKLVNAKKLLLGHFSTRYTDISRFVKEASMNFEGEIIAVKDGDTFGI